jgi:hypothetical protein
MEGVAYIVAPVFSFHKKTSSLGNRKKLQCNCATHIKDYYFIFKMPKLPFEEGLFYEIAIFGQ